MTALRDYTAVAPENRLKVWLAKQPLKKQAMFRELRVDKPLNDQKTHAREFEDNRGGVVKCEEQPASDVRDDTLRIIRYTFARLLETPTLHIECLCVAAGVLYNGDKEVDVAKRYGVTRACVSKLIQGNKILLGNLDPTGPCRSKHVRRTYTNRAKAVHLSNEQPVYCNGAGGNRHRGK